MNKPVKFVGINKNGERHEGIWGMQVHPIDPLAAAKDIEEHNRAIAARITDKSADLLDFSTTHITLISHPGEVVDTARPSDWIMWMEDREDQFYIIDNHRVLANFERVASWEQKLDETV